MSHIFVYDHPFAHSRPHLYVSLCVYVTVCARAFVRCDLEREGKKTAFSAVSSVVVFYYIAYWNLRLTSYSHCLFHPLLLSALLFSVLEVEINLTFPLFISSMSLVKGWMFETNDRKQLMVIINANCQIHAFTNCFPFWRWRISDCQIHLLLSSFVHWVVPGAR